MTPAAQTGARRPIVCICCGETRGHGGHGWCHRCYERWRYAGKPADGPPLPRPNDTTAARPAWQAAVDGRREDYVWLRYCDEIPEQAAARVGVHSRSGVWKYERARLEGRAVA